MSDACVILDFPAPTGRPGRVHFGAPVDVIEATSLDAVRPALRRVQRATARGAFAVGFVAYEAAPAFDRALTTRPHAGPAPLLWFGLFTPPDAAGVGSRAPAAATGAAGATQPSAGRASLDWQPATGRAAHEHAVAGIREQIAAGDVYQVNHTLRFHARAVPDPLVLYDALVAPRHGRYHALIRTPAWSVVSASPELFLDRAGGTLTTRPMKGTLRRGRWPAEDDAAARRLATSAKDRAENLMIVDLLRNDLGRVAAFGSVQVTSMFDVETYPTVHQMTSTITARLRDGVTLDDVFAATFPCGSVTGAPKVTAMRAIAALEDSPRGPYCGAIGVVRPDGSFTFNVAIRTLLLDHRADTAVYGAGGGITWDSRAGAEYDELVAKAAMLTERVPRFELIETLRLDDGAYARLELHLQRLAASARYWDFDEHTAANAAASLEAERARAPAGAWRVRLTANAQGDVAITRVPLAADAHRAIAGPPPDQPPRDQWLPDEPPDQSPRDQLPPDELPDQPPQRHAPPTPLRPVALAGTPVSRDDRLLFHKTTARAAFERERAAHPDAHDVLCWNEEGEVTEFTNGNVVVQIDGRLCTPPLDCGLLDGTFRRELIEAGVAHERVITLPELQHAERVWLINSVRGWVGVALADG